MTRYAVCDCETSGLFEYSKPADAEGQPRLAGFALLHLAEDMSIEREVSMLIRPEGWEMNAETAKIHGLTQEKLLAEGKPVREALDLYAETLDAGTVIVGYNISYDLKVMRGELRRAGLPDRFETTKSICCMRPMVDHCRLPKAKGNGYKLPKLGEAYVHVTREPHTGAHGALADAHAALKVFRFLIETRSLPNLVLPGVSETRRESAV